MDYMEGGSLTDVLGTTVDFKETHIAFVCREILMALAFMHHQYRLHRDIKSDNVLVSSECCLCILRVDFIWLAEVCTLMHRPPAPLRMGRCDKWRHDLRGTSLIVTVGTRGDHLLNDRRTLQRRVGASLSAVNTGAAVALDVLKVLVWSSFPFQIGAEARS